ncbi:hypothetical protein B0H14DRAFT_3490038 [Mycena olivaceomarginata]|nr:hypothetical protein B0H14DRAFT_3490038 [Mycena olivaceomarginata]
MLGTLSVNIFELCPNLRSITPFGHASSHNPPTPDYFYSPRAVPSLLKIKFDVPHWTRDKYRLAAWDRFFLEFKPKSLPNLHEIEFKCCEWPASERDIAKSCWVRWAEVLLKRNINLTDRNGTKWRPRLKVK